MRWGIYARNEFEGASHFKAGVLSLKGNHQAHIMSVSDYGAGQVEPFDVIAVFGLQGKGPDVLADYTAAGVPVLVIDYGYLKRTNHAHDWRSGHWQISLGGLNKLPSCDIDASRFDALGLTVEDHGGDPQGYTLLCVQTTGDASHGLSQEGLQQWVNEQKAKHSQNGELLIRPHPLQEHLTYGMPVCPAPTLEAALAGARLVITGNSNTGHEALMAGVPVLATIPGAAWAGLSSTTLPSRAARLAHFRRCAWGQWTWAEFRTGAPHRFLMTNVLS